MHRLRRLRADLPPGGGAGRAAEPLPADSQLSLWPKPVIDLEACISCVICVEGCPARCLTSAVDRGDKHLRAALTEPKKCISCGFCAEECPVEAILLAVPPAPAVEATAG